MTSERATASIFDIKSPDFDVDAYLSYLLKQKSLDELVKEEEDMVNNVRRLDSDVHQLVYENYNKFLTATNTVRKIQDEFNELEDEMSTLGDQMKNISSLIDNLGDVLGSRQTGVAQLASSYRAVKSVQFIFDLPATLQAHLDDRKFTDLVRVYLLAKQSLQKYSDLPNVARVCTKCEEIINDSKVELRSLITGCRIENTDEIIQAVELLLQLGAEPQELQEIFLAAAESSLRSDLDGVGTDAEDVLDLVDRGCGSFVPNLTLVANLHEKLFPDQSSQLREVLQKMLNDFHQIVRKFFLCTTDPKDCSIVVRALDRYYRKMSACTYVVSGLEFSEQCIELIGEVSRHETDISRAKIEEQMRCAIQDLRQHILSEECDPSSAVAKLEQTLVFNVKTALANLLLFSASDVTFSALPSSAFQAAFAVNVHEGLVAAAFYDLSKLTSSFAGAEKETRFVSPSLLLVVGVFLHHISTKSALYLMRLCEEQFGLAEKKQTSGWNKLRAIVSQSQSRFNLNEMYHLEDADRERNKELTTVESIVTSLKDAAQGVIRRFAEDKGLSIGEGVAKALETATISAAPPIGVRAAVRRAVEEVRECDRVLSSVLGGDGKKDIRSGRPPREFKVDALQRDTLWSERVDFHQPIHFNRGSILSAVIKVVLKTFIEIIRMQTFGKYAVEQIQVDCFYLQRNLAALVSDEVVVNSLTDQALSSALKRSLDPVLVHPNKLMQICEDGNKEKEAST